MIKVTMIRNPLRLSLVVGDRIASSSYVQTITDTHLTAGYGTLTDNDLSTIRESLGLDENSHILVMED